MAAARFAFRRRDRSHLSLDPDAVEKCHDPALPDEGAEAGIARMGDAFHEKGRRIYLTAE